MAFLKTLLKLRPIQLPEDSFSNEARGKQMPSFLPKLHMLLVGKQLQILMTCSFHLKKRKKRKEINI
jgi:hypothetical protein